jgi:cytochrome c oxidase subunit 1
MYRGSITLETPMCYALSFLFLFVIGGLTGLFLGSLATNVHLHDTYFVVAHFHYVMFGGTLMAFLGGLHYWWPKMFGKMYSEFWGRITCGLLFLSFNLTFFAQFIMGSRGMPRRYANYDEQFTTLHQISTAGSWLMGIAFIIMLVYLIHSLFRGRQAPQNPWGAATLDWQCPSPPPHDNFPEQPRVGDPYDLSHIEYDPGVGGYVSTEGMEGKDGT